MEKRLFLAIALSIAIIVSFQYLVVKPVSKEIAGQAALVETTPVPQKPAETIITPQVKPAIEEHIVEAETKRYVISFSNIGGAIKEIKLKDYKNSSGEPLVIADIKGPKEYILNMSSPLSQTPLDTAAYAIEKNGEIIRCSLRTKDLKITKEYILHKDKYGIDLRIIIKNISTGPKEFSYEIIGGAGMTESNEQDKKLIEVTSNVNGKSIGFRRPKGGRIITPGIVGWTALKNKYFSIILKPFDSKAQFHAENRSNELVVGATSNTVTISANSLVEDKFILYAGPSHIPTLKEFGYNLEETVNYGFFGGIAKVMIVLLRTFYLGVHSWGVSIILLSIFLNVILFPLTMKSFKSMHKMQELHPEMEKLKIKYKDNSQKLNKEVMELYKKYNINPLSGCLPLLLQMPIFIALYQALLKSIELRSASFLWIRDLSLPDALRLPFDLPIVGSAINVLPLVMVLAMVIQQKMSTKTMGSAVTEEQKQQQKIMLIIMPVVFGLIFYNMPSGLVLYWVVNTALTIVEQSVFIKKT